MDQLKVALRYLKRIHFWIICPLVTLLGIGAWYLAVGGLNEQKDDSVGEIQGYYTTVSQLRGTSPHPNSNVAEEMNKLITKTRTEIKQAWENKAAQQVEVLTWPDFPWSAAEKRDFLRIVQPLRPIERMVKVDDKDRLNIGYRQNYREYVWDELPNLAKLVGAAWVISSDDKKVVRGNAAEKQANTIVFWRPESQKSILQEHFKWDSGAGRGTPSTLEILYAQEDLWVLRHLMQIISRTNEGATTRHTAAVRKILDIKIGKAAVYSDVTIEVVGDGDSGSKKSRGNPDATGPDDPNADPAEGRYVDKNYDPLPAETLRQVMEKDGDLAPEQAYLAVAKRIPVRMRVSIDQRQINRLLVECANSELTVEVRQLLINPDYVAAGAPQSGSGGFADSGFNAPKRAAGGSQDALSQFPYDLEVEFYGIVSIYNPVDDAALGIEPEEASDEDTAASAAATFTR